MAETKDVTEMTVKELHEHLDKAGVDYNKSASKAELLAIAQGKDPGEAGGAQADTPSVDPLSSEVAVDPNAGIVQPPIPEQDLHGGTAEPMPGGGTIATTAPQEAVDPPKRNLETAPTEPANLAPVVGIPWEVYRTGKYSESLAEAATLQMDQARPGGEFIVNGVRVDANGQPL